MNSVKVSKIHMDSLLLPVKCSVSLMSKLIYQTRISTKGVHVISIPHTDKPSAQGSQCLIRNNIFRYVILRR